MPRYIDADALKKDLTRFYDNEVTARELIDEQPTADVQPVKRGRWINNTYTQVFPWKCEKCNYDSPARFNYCPNCGSRMAGDSDA